jgi:hypothetical protein
VIVIHVCRDGPVYVAEIEGSNHKPYTAGYGATWQEAIGCLVYINTGTPLLPGIRLDFDFVTPAPLFGTPAVDTEPVDQTTNMDEILLNDEIQVSITEY